MTGNNNISSRRNYLKTIGVVSTIGLAGCSGDQSDGSDGSDGSDSDGSNTSSDGTTSSAEPSTPWTTDDLRDQVEDGTEITIYTGTGSAPPWEQLINVINDEYGTNLVPNVFASDGGDVSQRLIQERQAGRDQADIISQAADLQDQIHEEGREFEGEYYELGFDEDYWFSNELADPYTERWYVSSYNGGPSTAMAINSGEFDAMGLEYPDDWNSLFDDQYADVETILPSYIVRNRIGWIVGHHAEGRDVEPSEWMTQMLDHLDFSGIENHTRGARAVGQGNYPFMFYNFPWVINRFTGDFPVDIHYPEGVQALMSSGHIAINNEAPNPWAARFVASATTEEVIQRRMVSEVDELAPGRTDLDYSGEDIGEYTQQLLSANVTQVSFWEEREFAIIGEEMATNVIDI